jgi:hypothetical protein
LGIAELLIWQIGGIPNDRQAELPKVNADLVGPARPERSL